MCKLLAIILLISIPVRFGRLLLFLVLVIALSWFWEGSYVIHPMRRRDGDLSVFAHQLPSTAKMEDLVKLGRDGHGRDICDTTKCLRDR
jgi:hypothetical protein